MHCTVYRLRRDGAKLPPEDVKLTAASGWLYWGQKSTLGPPERHAFLLTRADGKPGMDETLPTLRFARLLKIAGGGILMSGFEHPSSPPHTQLRQTWWIVPNPPKPEKPDA